MITYKEFLDKYSLTGPLRKLLISFIDDVPEDTKSPVSLNSSLQSKPGARKDYFLIDALQILTDKVIKIAKVSTNMHNDNNFDDELPVPESILWRVWQLFREYVPGEKTLPIKDMIKGKIPIGKIYRCYQKYGSCRRVGLELGIDKKTVSNALRALGKEDELNPPGWDFQHLPSKPGVVTQWLTEHPDVKLPRSGRAIAKIMGVSHTAVHNYFNTPKHELIHMITNLPDLIEHPIILNVNKKRRFSTSEFSTYTLDIVDGFGRIDMIGLVDGLEVRIKNIPIQAIYEKFYFSKEV